jgi:hypothetical protein
MKRAIVNFSNNRGWYGKGRERLKEMLPKFIPEDVDLFFFENETDLGSPLHDDNPYAFKLYAIQNVLEKEYHTILYMDASLYPIRDLTPIFNVIEKDGMFAQHAGHQCGTWANDRCLEYFGLSRDEAMEIPMYGNAGLLGLDLSRPEIMNFYVKWRDSMQAGMFKGAWNNNDQTESKDERCKGHRHDMVCGSLVMYQCGLTEKYQRGDQWMLYDQNQENFKDQIKDESILLVARPAI